MNIKINTVYNVAIYKALLPTWFYWILTFWEFCSDITDIEL